MIVRRLLRLAVVAVSFAACTAGAQAPSAEVKSQLAPAGKVRLAVTNNNPNYLTLPAKAPYSGLAVELGNAISRRLGVPTEIVVYDSVGALNSDAANGKWDVALSGVEASRRTVMDFTVPYAVSQNSFMVPKGSAIMTLGDVDRAGVRVAVAKGTVQHNHLKSTLRQASLVDSDNVAAARAALAEGRADAMAANRSTLDDLSAQMPGHRVVPGSFVEVAYALAVPKGRAAAVAYLDQVVKEMRANGEIAAAISHAKVKALTVPTN